MITPRDGLNPSRSPSRAHSRDSRESLAPGTLVDDYELVDLLGSGPRGSVYLARREDRTFTLKLLREEGVPAAILERLSPTGSSPIDHPHLAPTLATGLHEGQTFTVRPYLRGDSLADVIESFESGDHALPQVSPLAPGRDGRPRDGFFTTAIELVRGALEGLDRAHDAGLAHGRIHPGNLILSPSGRLILTDFAGAEPAGPSENGNGASPDRAARLEGPEVLYLAPEQQEALARGEHPPVRPSTDIYQMAAVLLHLVLRRVPSRLAERCQERLGDLVEIEAEIQADDEGSLSADLAAVLRRALLVDPSRRPASAAELARDLGRVLELEPPKAREEFETRRTEDEPSASAELRVETGTRALYERPREPALEPATKPVAEIPAAEKKPAPKAPPAPESPSPTETSNEKPTTPARKPESETVEEGEVPSLPRLQPEVRPGIDPALQGEAPASPAPARFRLPPTSPAEKGRETAPPVPVPPGLGLDPDEGTHTAEELGLLHHPSLARSPRRSTWKSSRFWVMAVVVLASSLVLTLVIQDLSEEARRHREKARELGVGVSSLTEALVALERDDLEKATRSLEQAAEILGQPAVLADERELTRLEELRGKFETVARDPLAARLDDPRPAFRQAALHAMVREHREGQRSGEALEALARALDDSHAGVRAEAIEACEQTGRHDLLTRRYPVADSSASLEMTAREFSLLLDCLKGQDSTRSTLAALDLDSMEKLDEALHRGRREVTIRPAAEIRIQNLESVSEASFVSRWIDLQLELEPEQLVTSLPRLQETRPDRLQQLTSALAHVGTPRALRALVRLTVTQELRCGTTGVEALEALGRGDILCELAHEPISRELRSLALQKATRLPDSRGDRALSALIRTDPRTEVRRLAVQALRRESFLDAHPEALIAGLQDPAVRQDVLEILGDVPHPAAIPVLLGALESGDARLRERVVHLVARTEDESVLIPLALQLRETRPSLRRATLEALETLGDDRALPLAAGLLEPGHEGLVRLARVLLERRVDDFREDLDLLVLSLEEILGIQQADFESHGLGRARRDLLLRRIQPDTTDFDRRVPPRIQELGNP